MERALSCIWGRGWKTGWPEVSQRKDGFPCVHLPDLGFYEDGEGRAEHLDGEKELVMVDVRGKEKRTFPKARLVPELET